VSSLCGSLARAVGSRGPAPDPLPRLSAWQAGSGAVIVLTRLPAPRRSVMRISVAMRTFLWFSGGSWQIMLSPAKSSLPGSGAPIRDRLRDKVAWRLRVN